MLMIPFVAPWDESVTVSLTNKLNSILEALRIFVPCCAMYLRAVSESLTPPPLAHFPSSVCNILPNGRCNALIRLNNNGFNLTREEARQTVSQSIHPGLHRIAGVYGGSSVFLLIIAAPSGTGVQSGECRTKEHNSSSGSIDYYYYCHH